jgi:hypothetical protein
MELGVALGEKVHSPHFENQRLTLNKINNVVD